MLDATNRGNPDRPWLAPAVAVAGALGFAEAACAEERVTGAALTQLVSGKTVDGQMSASSAPYIITFGKDGQYCWRWRSKYSCKVYDYWAGWSGPWRVHLDRLCLTHPKFKSEACYEVIRLAPSRYKLSGVGNMDGDRFTVR